MVPDGTNTMDVETDPPSEIKIMVRGTPGTGASIKKIVTRSQVARYVRSFTGTRIVCVPPDPAPVKAIPVTPSKCLPPIRIVNVEGTNCVHAIRGRLREIEELHRLAIVLFPLLKPDMKFFRNLE